LTAPEPGLVRRLVWFLALWIAGVLAVLAVAVVLRTVLGL
jgi:hypothetical protein